ncbi:uncharacterized protein [Prorops nasuta]|uniref:uncharacterized protein isoform X2 n=2 Tax=Prorops nasuta TaxID=863751 RepID=UPI0034CEBF6D
MPQRRSNRAKFRWSEGLTCRFIQLRKENGKLFTGRKYSAQAGWELILRQMREEFPTIMSNVHYRVLKKKWSNLLQQYKELRNPVHGDRNKSDDVSWPFFLAIDEVLEGNGRKPEVDEDYVDPREFLCISVAPEVLGPCEFPATPSLRFDDSTEIGSSETVQNRRQASRSTARRKPDMDVGSLLPLNTGPKIEKTPMKHCEKRSKIGDTRSQEKMETFKNLEKIAKRKDGTAMISKISLRNRLDVLIEKLRAMEKRGREPEVMNCSDKTQLGERNGSVREAEKSVKIEMGKRELEIVRKPRLTLKKFNFVPRTMKRSPRRNEGCKVEECLGKMLTYAKSCDSQNRVIMWRILAALEIIADKL